MCGGENDRPEARPPRAVRGDATSGGGRTILRGDEKEEPDMPSLPNTVREVRLKSRPQGMPAPANFEHAETPTHVPDEGQTLIRTAFMYVDPYMRGRTSARKRAAPPSDLGAATDARFVADGLESAHRRFPTRPW